MTAERDHENPACESCLRRLDEWRRNELSEGEAREVETHLASCDGCADELAAAEQLGALLRQAQVEAGSFPGRSRDAYFQNVSARVRLRLSEDRFDEAAQVESDQPIPILTVPKAAPVRREPKRPQQRWWLATAASIAAVAGLAWLVTQPTVNEIMAPRARVAVHTAPRTKAKTAAEMASSSSAAGAGAVSAQKKAEVAPAAPATAASVAAADNAERAPVSQPAPSLAADFQVQLKDSEAGIPAQTQAPAQAQKDVGELPAMEVPLEAGERRSAAAPRGLVARSSAPPSGGLSASPGSLGIERADSDAAAPPSPDKASPRQELQARMETPGRMLAKASAPADLPVRPRAENSLSEADRVTPQAAGLVEAQAEERKRNEQEAPVPAAAGAGFAAARPAAPAAAPLPSSEPAKALSLSAATSSSRAFGEENTTGGLTADGVAENSGEQVFARAESAQQSGRFREAVDLYGRAADLAPGSRIAAYSRMRTGDIALEQLNDKVVAREAYSACLRSPLREHLTGAQLQEIRRKLEETR